MGYSALLGRIQTGDHVCVPVQGRLQRLADQAVFVEGGLHAGEQVLLIVDEPGATGAGLAERVPGFREATRRGQVALVADREMYLEGGGLEPERMVERLSQAAAGAVAAGYGALRVTGDLSAAAAGPAGAEIVVEYESRVNALFTTLPLSAMCHYDPAVTGWASWQRVARTHPTTLRPDAGGRQPGGPAAWQQRLRCRRTRAGLCLTGEIDLANHGALSGLLAGVPTMVGTCVLDASGLEFTDAAGAAWILRAAIARRGQPTMIYASVVLARMLDLLGAAAVPGLRVVAVRAADAPSAAADARSGC